MAGQITQNGYSDEPFNVWNNTFVRDGYEFICWNTKKDGSGTDIQPNAYIDCQNDTVLYAKWKLLYKYMQLIRSGSMTIDSNIVNKFEDDAYEYTPIAINWTLVNSFELTLKIFTPAENANNQVLFGMQNNSYFNLTLQNYQMIFDLTDSKSSMTLKSECWYYVRFSKSATSYTVSVSEDNENFTTVISTSSDQTIENNQLYIGRKYSIRYFTKEQYDYQYTVPVYQSYTKSWINTCSTGKRNHSAHIDWSGHGYWAKGAYAGYHQVVEHEIVRYDKKTEKRYKTVVAYKEAETFKGKIDFNESYIVLSGIKYKFKA